MGKIRGDEFFSMSEIKEMRRTVEQIKKEVADNMSSKVKHWNVKMGPEKLKKLFPEVVNDKSKE